MKPSVAFHTENSHLTCISNQITAFYIKCITALKWVKMQIIYIKLIELKVLFIFGRTFHTENICLSFGNLLEEVVIFCWENKRRLSGGLNLWFLIARFSLVYQNIGTQDKSGFLIKTRKTNLIYPARKPWDNNFIVSEENLWQNGELQ